MIDHISIRDFAIIDNVDVDLNKGLSIITGETGSGKSILVTAISLALGSRADSSYVRNGKEKAVVQLTATINRENSDSEEIVISREVNSSGKNLCKLNGNVVTLSELASKCREIADIHGQYDNQSLLDPENHIGILDGFDHKRIAPIKAEYQRLFSIYQEKKRELNSLLSLESENIRKLDFYKFEISEIDSASPKEGEDRELDDRLNILQNSEKIFEKAKAAYDSINGSGTGGNRGAYSDLGIAVENLEEISSYSEDIKNTLDEAKDIYYRLEDIAGFMSDLIDRMTFDPGEIDSIIERLNVLDNLKKKYSGGSNSISDVISYREKIGKELNSIENYDEEKDRRKREVEEAEEKLLAQGKKLSQAREKGSKELREKILKELKDLSFEESDIEIALNKLDEPGPNGMESAEILITTNKGEPLKPLVKTSSGGEISRIMLAIKNITAAYDGIPTLIFDEIDQGISGRTASVVGRKLREISKSHQVICITHLPQIAAMGDSSYRIYKESTDSRTYTHVEKLGEEDRIMELARLLGGEDISDSAIENARELIREGSK